MHTKKSRLSNHVLGSTSMSMLVVVCAFDNIFLEIQNLFSRCHVFESYTIMNQFTVLRDLSTLFQRPFT